MQDFLTAIENEKSGNEVRLAIEEAINFHKEYLLSNLSFIESIDDEANAADSYYINYQYYLQMFKRTVNDIETKSSNIEKDFDEFLNNNPFGKYLMLMEGFV